MRARFRVGSHRRGRGGGPALALLLLALSWSPDAFGLGFPVEPLDQEWTPSSADDLQLIALRLELVPSVDEEREARLWLLDATMVLRNLREESRELELALPNIWSENDLVVGVREEPFWGEAYVNGSPVRTEVVRLVPNPAHPGVGFRVARRFTVELDGRETAHIRLRYALPAQRLDTGEERVTVPFRLRPLWDGPIEFGTFAMRWRGRAFAFRSNLSSYALYADRVEWFVQGFEPEGDLEVQFLPQRAALLMIARSLGCPSDAELRDRVSEGSFEQIAELLESYPTDVLEVCAAVPAVLGGSLGDARESGLEHATLERFAPEGSNIEGPLLIADPDFRETELPQADQIYRRFLLGEVARRSDETIP